MFVYDMGIVDFFHGMMPLNHYIKFCPEKDNGFNDHFLTIKQLKSFLIKCFIQVKMHETYWEGDIRDGEIAISGIPRPTTETPYKLIVFKQDNNGNSFIVSECVLFTYDDVEKFCTEIRPLKKDITSGKITEWFEESYDLVESLFKEESEPSHKTMKNLSEGIKKEEFEKV